MATENLPIAEYALLSDCRSAALVSREGSIDWLCMPRFDGPSVFARLLDATAGHWSLHPAGAFEARRRYVDGTMVLETTFETEAGTVVLLDAMAVGATDEGHDLGTGSPGVLLRGLECTSGAVEMELEYAPRLEYGLVYPLLTPVPGGLRARGGSDALLLSSPVELPLAESAARASFRLEAGQRVAFALQHRRSWEPAREPWSQDAIEERIESTVHGWRTWSEIHQGYTGPWRDLVHHSGRVLQALTFQPTGAIVAAPTTSLPESVGGERNWDYRFTWVRDACLTLEALWVAACPDEAHWFFSWMAGAVATQIRRGVDIQIMFGVGGERDLSERSLNHLAGWRASR